MSLCSVVSCFWKVMMLAELFGIQLEHGVVHLAKDALQKELNGEK